MVKSRCGLTQFQRRLYCYKKRVDEDCLKPSFLGHRCPYLIWDKEAVIKEARKGVKEIVSLSGFTKDALEYAEKHRPGLRLKHRDEIIKPRRRKKIVVKA
jgi:hypothetical protein